MLLVISGCLALFGNCFSTVSAHFFSAAPLLLSGVVRRRQEEESGELAASYSRFSSDLQSESSNDDQKRCCREAAEKDGFRLLPDFEFSDSAVSGTKRNRTGLNAMLMAAERGEFSVLYFHSLSRLARESIITMPVRFGIELGNVCHDAGCCKRCDIAIPFTKLIENQYGPNE